VTAKGVQVTAIGGNDDERDTDPGARGVRAESGRRGPTPFTADEVDQTLTDLLFGEPYQRPGPLRSSSSSPPER
jgi:hypothetical protein